MRSTKRKAAASPKETSGLSKSRKAKSTRHHCLSPRLRRIARALLQASRTARALMTIAPCNNSAQYIKTLRDSHGLKIPCARISFTTMDGAKSFHGRYSLTASDRQKLQRLIRGGEV